MMCNAMKLHLPTLLRKSLLAVLAAVAGVTMVPVYAGVTHSDVPLQTYTDFGQNKGRYVVEGRVNALLDHIRYEEGGIGVAYTDGQDTYYIPYEQGMISFYGQGDNGAYAAVAPNFMATVLHNGSNSASFGEREIGAEHAINYTAVDIRHTNSFRLSPGGGADFMLQRQTKIFTDTTWNPVTESVTSMPDLMGTMFYHSGAGEMKRWEGDTKVWMASPYQYICGSMSKVTSYTPWGDGSETYWLLQPMDYNSPEVRGASPDKPMPYGIDGGDSGSPVYIYNSKLGRYEYISAMQGSTGDNSTSWSMTNLPWALEALERFHTKVDMSTHETVYLNAIMTPGEAISETVTSGDKTVEYSTVLYSGVVTDGQQNALGSYQGLQSGVNTWADLSDLKDTQNWYAYGADHLLAGVPDLFYNSNLVFSSTKEQNDIVLKDTVDLGAGYVELNATGAGKAVYTISSEAGEGNLLNSAGYVVNAGAELHVRLNNPEDYMYEWRKNGAGDLYIDGTGDTNALLALGGSGTTYLQQEGGYAAYNVLVGSGAKVVIKDLGQIERDFTFGKGGGTLDLNGHGMDWYEVNTQVEAKGFSINALTEEAVITNSSGASSLVYKEGGERTFLGSFRDSATGSLSVDYQGGGTWTLNGIHTNLKNHAGSSFTVSNGQVVLSGINTVHGMGSATGHNDAERLVNVNDWHYADAAMDVQVKSGAQFELGSHARLTGDVTVQEGASFVMREGVKHQREYVEGSAFDEDTYKYADYYGLKGDVALAGEMKVAYSAGTTADLEYSGSISGSGSLTVDTGVSGGRLILKGDNSDFSGTKTLLSGILVAETSAALGDVSRNRWVMERGAVISSRDWTDAAEVMGYVDSTSSGTVALTQNISGQLNLRQHAGVFVGAGRDCVVQYGAAGTSEALNPNAGAWKLGGGEGTLVVNYLLSGENDLLLGETSDSRGTVVLANGDNDFSGRIQYSGKGMVLRAESGALGDASLNLEYGYRLGAASGEVMGNLDADSAGVLLLDDYADKRVDVSRHGQLYLAAGKDMTFSGDILAGAGDAYRLGAVDGSELTLLTNLSSRHGLVVDGMGEQSGTVVLAGNAVLGGDVSVQGNRLFTDAGSVTLALGQDMRFSGVVTLEKGGTLDVAGHSLILDKNLVSHGGRLVDSVGTGALVLDASAGDMSIGTPISMSLVRKTGSGNLVLSGANDIDHLYVDAGKLTLGSATATTGSTVHLAAGASLDVAGYGMNGHLETGVGSGNFTLARTGSSSTALRGNISLGAGSRLDLASGGTYTLSGASYGGSGAVLGVNGSRMVLDSKTGIAVNGTLEVSGGTTLYSSGSATDMARTLEHVRISDGSRLTLDEASWNTLWNVKSLSGTGELYWKSNTTHSKNSRLVLTGDNDFSGSIILDRLYKNDARTHGAYVELAADGAAKNATISLKGASASAVASLAVNTDNARIKGLSGNEHSYVYAGASMADAALSGTARPATTRLATLTVDTDAGENYTYAGTLGNSSDTAASGLSLVKTGAGAQSFTGGVTLASLSVEQGTLSLSTPTIRGNVAVGYGATLNAGDMALQSGQSFNVTAGAGTGTAPASFSGSLTLAGGMLGFSADVLNLAAAQGTAALSLGGVSMAEGTASQTLSFNHFYRLNAGTTYTLATGDWSGLTGSLTASGLGYYDAAFSTNDAGHLQMQLTMNSKAVVFAGRMPSTNSGSILVFDDSSATKSLTVSGGRKTIDSVIFNSSEDYRILDAGWYNRFNAGSLIHEGTGTTYIHRGLRTTGDAYINAGTVVLQTLGVLQGAISGAGKLVVDWGSYAFDDFTDTASMYGLNIRGLDTLHIKSGTYGTTGMAAMDVENVILESGATYIQGTDVQQSSAFVANGGVFQLGSSNSGKTSLGGSLVQNADTVLNIRSGNAYLNTALTQNGYALTQTGSGTVHIGADSAAVLERYTVSSGTLSFDGGSLTTGHGNINVSAGAGMVVAANAGTEVAQLNINGGSLQVQAGGALVGSTALNVSGDTAAVRLEGDSSYTGGTTIAAGNVVAGHTNALGSGAVVLNGGTLSMESALKMGSLSGTGGSILTNGKALSIEQAAEGSYAGSIAGAGNMVKSGAAKLSLSGATELGIVDVASGELEFAGNTSVDKLRLAADSTVTLRNDSSGAGAGKQLDAVVMADGSVLKTYNGSAVNTATRVGSLRVDGATATLKDDHHSGYMVVETLNKAADAENVTLKLSKTAASMNASLFEFGSATAAAGNFEGQVMLSSDNSSANGRSAFILISGQEALSGAVVNLASASSGAAILGLGVNTDTATVAGLESAQSLGTERAKVFSGSVACDSTWSKGGAAPATVGDKVRTLNVCTSAGSLHTFRGELMGSLNLHLSGEGTQVLAAESSNFDGSITVQGGTLRLEAPAMGLLSTEGGVLVNGGTLDLSAQDFAAQGGISLAGSLTVENGYLNLGQLADTGTSYTIFNLASEGASLADWESMQDRIMVNGAHLVRYEGAVLALSGNAATLSLSSLEAANFHNLVWNGDSAGVWNQSSSSWSMSADSSAADIAYLNGDSVRFLDDAALAVAEGISVKDLTVGKNAHLSLSGALEITGNVVLEEASRLTLSEGAQTVINGLASMDVTAGATVELKDTITDAAALSSISGAGRLMVALAPESGAMGLNMEQFEGELVLQGGSVLVDETTLGESASIRITSAANQMVFGAAGAELRNDVVLDASTAFHVQSGAATVSGAVSGLGGISKTGAGNLVFTAQNSYQGATNIQEGALVLDLAEGGTYEFRGDVEGGTLQVASGTNMANGGHRIGSAVSLAENATWKLSSKEGEALSLQAAVNGAGTLEVLEGSTMNSNGKRLNAALLVNGGVAEASGDNTQSLAGHITVQNGGTLRFLGGTDVRDILDYNASNKNITVDGGTLDFGKTRQTMGSWKLRLSNGAKVTGEGGKYDVGSAAMDFNNGGTIYATAGESSISATSRLRYGSTVTYDVASGASLDVSGLVHADGGANGGVVKNNAGVLHLNNSWNDLDSVVVNGGTANIHGAQSYNLAELRAAAGVQVGFFAGTTGNTATEASVRVSGRAEFAAGARLNADLIMAQGATLQVAAGGVHMGSSITLTAGSLLGDELLSRVQTMSAGDSTTLFTSVDQLVLDDGSTSYTYLPGELSAKDNMLASTYFTNLTGDDYVLTFRGSGEGNGTLAIAMVPEPASATLSLLALAALAARRRRK